MLPHRRARAIPKPGTLELADQFSKDAWEDWIISAPIFCNPADKNGEGIKDEKRHLTCYALEKQHRAEVNVHVVVSNQFGKHELLVGTALVLCVPR